MRVASFPSVKLKWVARLYYGDSLAAEDRRPGRVPVMGSNGSFDTHDQPNLQGPSIIIGRKGSHGKVNWSDEPSWVTDTAFGIDRSMTDADLRWLYYALQTMPLAATSQDTGVPGLSREKAYELRLPLPPLITQRRIADMLDTETARIDTLLDKNDRMLSLLNERETSVITRAVMGESIPGSDPCSFPLVALRYRTRGIQAGVDFASSDLSTEASDGLVRYVRTTDIASINRLTDTAVYAPASEVPDSALARDGDLLATRAGSLGTAYVHRGEPVAVAGYLVRVQFDGSSDPAFYGYWCRSRPFLDALEVGATQTTIQNFSASKYASLPAPAPPLETQRRVVALLDAEMAKADALRSVVNRQQELLRLRRQALTTAAVTGQIEV